MAHILQNQRGAIESLREGSLPPPSNVEKARLFLRDEERFTELFIGGVSMGFGTCASIKDLDVLVLSTRPRERPLQPRRKQEPAECAYTVLPLNLKERKVGGTILSGVQRLDPVTVEKNRIIFVRTGEIVTYVAI